MEVSFEGWSCILVEWRYAFSTTLACYEIPRPVSRGLHGIRSGNYFMPCATKLSMKRYMPRVVVLLLVSLLVSCGGGGGSSAVSSPGPGGGTAPTLPTA